MKKQFQRWLAMFSWSIELQRHKDLIKQCNKTQKALTTLNYYHSAKDMEAIIEGLKSDYNINLNLYNGAKLIK